MKIIDINERLKQFSPEDNVIASNYVNLNTKCHFRCTTCGKEWDAIPNTILHRHSRHVCLNCFPPYREKELKKSSRNFSASRR